MFLCNTLKCLNIFEKVFVSSDSDYVLEVARAHGAIPIKRGEELCGDTPNIPVYQHALKQMGRTNAIVAVQANSPTLNSNLLALVKKVMDCGIAEAMTCHRDYSIYGSVWALSKEKLLGYGDPYKPQPEILIVDESVDIHTEADYEEAICQSIQQSSSLTGTTNLS